MLQMRNLLIAYMPYPRGSARCITDTVETRLADQICEKMFEPLADVATLTEAG